MRSVCLIFTAALFTSIAACGQKGGQPQPSGPPGAGGSGGAAPVSVAEVVERAVPVTVRAVGTVEASSTVDIRAQVAGPILSIGFAEGQDVKAGDLLFTIDPRPLQGTVNQAESVLARDTAQLNNLIAQMRRADDLFSRGVIPKSDHDTLAANVASMRATVAADAGTLESAKLQLSYTKITAPVSGRTGALQVHQGSLVRANDTAPMVTISRTAPVNVVFAVPARLLGRLRGPAAKDVRVNASIPGVPESSATGSLGFIDSGADPGTDTIKVKGVFPNGNRELWPGQYVDVLLQLSIEPHALIVPTSAVQSGQQGQFVYVVGADHKAQLKPVVVGWIDGDRTILESGVSAGDQVVTDGQLRLTNGATVSIKPAVAPARQ